MTLKLLNRCLTVFSSVSFPQSSTHLLITISPLLTNSTATPTHLPKQMMMWLGWGGGLMLFLTEKSNPLLEVRWRTALRMSPKSLLSKDFCMALCYTLITDVLVLLPPTSPFPLTLPTEQILSPSWLKRGLENTQKTLQIRIFPHIFSIISCVIQRRRDKKIVAAILILLRRVVEKMFYSFTVTVWVSH